MGRTDRRRQSRWETLAARGCTRIALAQFSMARARAACEAATGLPVLTTVDSAVRALQLRLNRN